MKCPYCDFENKSTSKFCENCGARIIAETPEEEDQVHEYEGGMYYPDQESGSPQIPPNQFPPNKNSKLGIAVLILGFLGMGSRFFGLIAICLGVYDFVKHKDRKHVLVTIGMVLAVLGLLSGNASRLRSGADTGKSPGSVTAAPEKAATATPAPTKAATATPTPTKAATPTAEPAKAPSDASKAEPAEPVVPEADDREGETSAFDSYEDIYETYAQKLRDASPGLLAEYEAEAAVNEGGVEGLAEISSKKITKLAEIDSEGTSEMASFMMFRGSGNYEEYEDWAGKLYDVYEEEAQKIMDAYMDSASASVFDDIDLGDLGDFGDFDLGDLGY